MPAQSHQSDPRILGRRKLHRDHRCLAALLRHVRDDQRAMSEIFRVLRPGGWAVLQVPIAPDLPHTYENSAAVTARLRLAMFGQRDHRRLYGADYPERLRNTGFTVEVFDPKRYLGPDVAINFGLIPDELLYVAHKPLSRPLHP